MTIQEMEGARGDLTDMHDKAKNWCHGDKLGAQTTQAGKEPRAQSDRGGDAKV